MAKKIISCVLAVLCFMGIIAILYLLVTSCEVKESVHVNGKTDKKQQRILRFYVNDRGFMPGFPVGGQECGAHIGMDGRLHFGVPVGN